MRMKPHVKHDTCYAQHFSEVYSEPCQASEMELFAKTVNYLKPLKTVSQKDPPWIFGRVLSKPLVSLSFIHMKWWRAVGVDTFA